MMVMKSLEPGQVRLETNLSTWQNLKGYKIKINKNIFIYKMNTVGVE